MASITFYVIALEPALPAQGLLEHHARAGTVFHTSEGGMKAVEDIQEDDLVCVNEIFGCLRVAQPVTSYVVEE